MDALTENNKTDSTIETLDKIINSGTKLTPMMEQYYSMKKQCPGVLMMFRMGDFYELFFDDARTASKILNISLTHRGKLGEFPIPMSGMPHHAAATYIDRITSIGKKVAICEQIEDPKAAKGIVKRAITQIVSPSMPYDLDKASATEHKYMASAFQTANDLYLVLIDYTTGDFFGMSLRDESELLEKLVLYRPKEFISYHDQWINSPELSDFLNNSFILNTVLSQDYFEEKYSGIYIEKLIPTYKRDQIIKLNTEILSPIGALSFYICTTQSLEDITHFRPFQMISTDEGMKITYPTLVGLEIFPKDKENYKNSILGFLDSTKTALGSRKLKTILQSPLREHKKIVSRQSAIEYFLENENLRDTVRTELFEVRDIERIMAKVSSGRVNGSDLLNLANASKTYFRLLKTLKKFPKEILPHFSKTNITKHLELADKIISIINDEIGAKLEKGNLIRGGFSKKRDRLYKLTKNSADSLIELETKYRKKTGISNLKIKHNNVAGYFIEVSKSHTHKVPKEFVRRQTLVNNERYQSPELAEFEKEILSAQDKLLKVEREIFDDLVTEVATNAKIILQLADAIALLDVFQSLAWTAFQENFTKPEIKPKTKILNINQAWHPLIKASIKDQFVCHDLEMDKHQYFGLITGPNMAGKTTVMREMAIIQFLAQIGSYVPAESATVGICDYIFSRLGASDDIIKGQSTFMVEMSETAEIIRHSTENSLIVLDEIGRGTSTYDGLSIAWTLVEYFVNKTQALTLFSTHYHELVDLVNTLPAAKNLTVKTISEKGNVQFLYKLIEEGAGQSFGIFVAKLAGLPKEVLYRSQEILTQLEKNHNHANEILGKSDNQMEIFGSQSSDSQSLDLNSNPVINELEALDIQNMTPMQALTKLHELQATLH